ncbi:hypothetical protein EYZ11_008260 [Aspergillus tanneri]|uniref:Telomeric single stranded DNA binding POT1/Cdc13 domain-containing protein n=1 Tax=Aspergillus tanneri TaxID=1220188 RepID=A0A4S3JD55_9EURO|nr:hypothetical protein EYZ11_008260 [Aspergillus tanneri]
MDDDEQPQITEPLRSARIPIAQLSPTAKHLSEASIHAIVTLLWPYSSSSKSLGLLLSEPDVRLRPSNGQVKVLFHGRVAEDVAKSRIGIGDEVYLKLLGSRFVTSEAATQTPVNPPSSPPHSTDVATAAPATPSTNGNIQLERPDTAGGLGSWQSPAFVGRSRTSFGGLVDSAFDPFAEDDGFVPGKGRKRPRFSMRSSDWRLIDEPESPGDKDVPFDWSHIFDEDEDEEAEMEQTSVSENPSEVSSDALGQKSSLDTAKAIEVDNSTAQVSPELTNVPEKIEDSGQFLQPFTVRRPGIFGQDIKQHTNPHHSHLPTDTPRLHPIPSPGLPIPSPLVTTSTGQQGYFTDTPQFESKAVTTSLTQKVGRLGHESSDALLSISETKEDEHTDSILGTDSQTTWLAESRSGLPDTIIDHVLSAPSPSASTAAMTNMQLDEVARITVTCVQEDQQPIYISSNLPAEAEHPGLGGFLEMPKMEKTEDHGAESIQSGLRAREALERHERAHMVTEVHGQNQLEISARDGDRAEPESISGDSSTADSSDIIEYDFYGRGESLPDGKTGIPAQVYDYNSQPEESEGEVSSEERYEREESEGEEDVESFAENEYYGGDRESEIESDSMSVGSPTQPQLAPKTSEPEVIVLDSESEDEAPPSSHARDVGVRVGPPTNERESMSSPSLGSEGFTSDESSMVSEDEKRPEAEFHPELQIMQDEPKAAERRERRLSKNYSEEWSEEEDSEEERSEDDRVSDEDMKGKMIPVDHFDNELSEHEQGEHEVGEFEGVGSERIENEAVQFEQAICEPRKEQSVEIRELDYENARDDQIQGRQAKEDESPNEAFFPASDIHYAGGSDVDELPEKDAASLPVLPQDSLDRALHVLQSSEGPHADSGVSLHHADLAIDPELYNSSSAQAMATTSISPDNGQDGRPSETREVLAHVSEPGQRDAVAWLPTPELTQERSALQGEGEMLPIEHAETFTSAEIDKEETAAVQDFGPRSASSVASEEESVRVEVSFSTLKEHSSSEESKALQGKIALGDDDGGTLDSDRLVGIDRHHPGLRSKLSYFAPLATLVDHYNATIDSISVASEVRPITRASSGKKDYILTLRLTDPSMAGTTYCAQIFRPFKAALPTVDEGDSILLRNFKVNSFNHAMILVSQNTSAWVVFSGSKSKGQVDGPPVEYGDEEQAYATNLRQWYQEDGVAMVADAELQASIERASREGTPASSVALSDSGSFDSTQRDGERGEPSMSSLSSRRNRKSHRRITIHQLRDGRRYTEVGSPSGRESIHELRDGTVYANH